MTTRLLDMVQIVAGAAGAASAFANTFWRFSVSTNWGIALVGAFVGVWFAWRLRKHEQPARR